MYIYIHTYIFYICIYIYIYIYTYNIYTDPCSSTSPQPQNRSAPGPPVSDKSVSGRHALQSLVEDRCCFGTGSRTSTATWRCCFVCLALYGLEALRYIAIMKYYYQYDVMINTTLWLCMTTSWLFVVVFLMCLSRFLWLLPFLLLWWLNFGSNQSQNVIAHSLGQKYVISMVHHLSIDLLNLGTWRSPMIEHVADITTH